MKPDNWYLEKCEALAIDAANNGESAVGALIVRDNKIISEAGESTKLKNDITCHAEIEAIRHAVKKLKSNDLSNCILYTTHEPCIMCSYVIRYYRIKEVVFLKPVEFLGGFTSSMPLLISENVPAHWRKPPAIKYAGGRK